MQWHVAHREKHGSTHCIPYYIALGLVKGQRNWKHKCVSEYLGNYSNLTLHLVSSFYSGANYSMFRVC